MQILIKHIYRKKILKSKPRKINLQVYLMSQEIFNEKLCLIIDINFKYLLYLLLMSARKKY